MDKRRSIEVGGVKHLNPIPSASKKGPFVVSGAISGADPETGKVPAELGLPVGAAAVAQHYEDILDVFIADEADANEVEDLGVPVRLTRTLMSTIEDREALAKAVLAAGRRAAWQSRVLRDAPFGRSSA